MRYARDVNDATLADVVFVLLGGAFEIVGLLLKTAFYLLGELLKGLWVLLVQLWRDALSPLSHWFYQVAIVPGSIWLYKKVKGFFGPKELRYVDDYRPIGHIEN